MANPVSACRGQGITSSTSRLNGQVVDTIDGFVAAGGQFHGYTRSYNLTVPSSGLLSVVLRDRFDTTVDPYGMSISAIEIVGGGGALQFRPPALLPSGQVGTQYQYQFAASGGLPPYTFTLRQGSLPPGTGLSASGLLSGTPTQGGIFSLLVQACDSTPGQPQCLSATTAVKIAQQAQPLQILTTSLPSGSQGSPYDVFLQGQGGVPPYTWMTPSILPPGLQLTAAGELKGTPQQAGTFALSFRLSDSAGTPPATVKLTLTISGLSLR